ncbi:plexin domain-containing protein 2, partial [Ostrinia furnacalis]|uniref:plexin domain-containing protein 2 n=1 Tax=Ostrinia furnacalis TaxID=93504 RepID=UPI00103E8406
NVLPYPQTVQLSFKFPFYGNWIQNITVATGGFIFTGEHTHAWLAATQYIAPLMANFDTSLNNDSIVKLSDDGEKFTAFWENVTLRESPDKPFTFAVTLYKNGDIVFAYKAIPLRVQDIDDSAHPVKIGISDAYLTDRVIFYVRRKTIYEYHRVTFKHYEIGNNTVLRLTALPTCLQYSTCDGCLNHNTSFDCSWCENLMKCSSGTDRNKQDWQLRNCDKSLFTNASMCPARAPAPAQDGSTYVTDAQSSGRHQAVVNTLPANEPSTPKLPPPKSGAENSPFMAPVREPAKDEDTHSAIGGAVSAILVVTIVCALAAWTLYAFKNPHTRSGQLLIKYRPSQWSWRRGEARYTAATIHM